MDLVYGYSRSNTPTIEGGLTPVLVQEIFGIPWFVNDPFATSTHFWDADNGDALASDLEGTFSNKHFKFTIPNAYTKIMQYAYPSSQSVKWDIMYRLESV